MKSKNENPPDVIACLEQSDCQSGKQKAILEKRRKNFIEHNVQVEEIIFSTIVKLGEHGEANATVIANLTHALVEIQKNML